MNDQFKFMHPMLEQLGISTVVLTADACIATCSRCCEPLFGLPVEQLVGRRMLDLGIHLVDEDGRPEQVSDFPLNRAAIDSSAVQFIFGLQSMTGAETCWLSATMKSGAIGGGDPVLTFLTLTDVTGLVQDRLTNKQIFQAKSEWESTVDALQDIVTIQDKEMRIVRANKAAHELFGYRLGELNGKKCYEVFFGGQFPCKKCPVTETAVDGCPHIGTIHNPVLDRTFSVSSFPIFSQNGKMHLLVHVARDVTREELLEQQLHQAMKMEALGTLAGGIAHDFNNILTAMIGYGEIAKGRLAKDHPARKDIDQVLAGGDRAVDLVKQILTFSRPESYGQFRLFKLQYIVKEIIKLLRPSLPATIEVVHEIDLSCRSIFADPGQIFQVLMNLCTNARQSIGEDHGRITIRLAERRSVEGLDNSHGNAAESGAYLDLEVSDSGCGIEEDKLAKIFDPFYTTKRIEQGTGLGLAVVHGIIKKHQGDIKVTSTVGVGTTFHVYLAVDGRAVDTRKKRVSVVRGGNERIMVVDDEVPVTEVLRAILEDVGYLVTTFHDSIAAVKQFRENPDCCDLVLTDMQMPSMTGAELAREFLAQRPDLPIIMLTGHSDNFDSVRAKKMGIRELIQKPAKKDKLQQIVRKVLEHGKDIDH